MVTSYLKVGKNSKKNINDPFDPVIQIEIDTISSKYINQFKIGNKRLTKFLTFEVNQLIKSLIDKITVQSSIVTPITPLPPVPPTPPFPSPSPVPSPPPSPVPSPPPSPVPSPVPSDEEEEEEEEEPPVPVPERDAQELKDEIIHYTRLFAETTEPFSPLENKQLDLNLGQKIALYYNHSIHNANRININKTIMNKKWTSFIRSIAFVFVFKYKPNVLMMLFETKLENIQAIVKLFQILLDFIKENQVKSNTIRAVEKLLYPTTDIEIENHNVLEESVYNLLKSFTPIFADLPSPGPPGPGGPAGGDGLKKKNKNKIKYLSDKVLVKRSKNIMSAIALGNSNIEMKNELDSIFSAMVSRKLMSKKEVLLLTKKMKMK
jgi:hypothetical protein